MTYIPEGLRRIVVTRADSRCEYCRLHENDTFFTHEIDHIYAEKHAGSTTEDNLCLACIDCNRHKGSDLCSTDPEANAIVALYHPRREHWNKHFRLDYAGIVEPLSSTGRVTVKLLRINQPDLVTDRARLIRLGSYSEAN